MGGPWRGSESPPGRFALDATVRGTAMKKVGNSREPSKASLRQIPEVDLASARIRRNPYAARVAAKGIVHNRRERPTKGAEDVLTEPGANRGRP